MMIRYTRKCRLISLITSCFSLGFIFAMFLVTTFQPDPMRFLANFQLNPNAEHSFLLVLILTAPGNIDRRNTIRQTWLPLRFRIDDDVQEAFADKIPMPIYNEQGFVEPLSLASQAALKDIQPRGRRKSPNLTNKSIRVAYKFVVGSLGTTRSQYNQLEFENDKEGDIMIFPKLVDSYSNLTQKLLMSVTALTYENKFKYILKCDDDTYVNIDQLTAELFAYDRLLRQQNYKPNPTPELYWGYFNGKANVKQGGKWQETNFKACDLYSPYALGGGYVISAGIANYIFDHWKTLSPYVSEDVSMGAWLASLRHVYRKHDVRFDSGYLPRSCKPYHLLVHKRDEKEMKRLRGGDLCSFEQSDLGGKKRPLEYFYDWEAIPSKCCVPNLQ